MKTKLIAFSVIMGFILLVGCQNQSPPPLPSSVVESSSSLVVAESQPTGSSNQNTTDVPPLNQDSFDEEQLKLISLANTFYTVGVKVTEDMSDKEKADFFKFIISTDLYADRLAEWKGEEAYHIALEEVQQIIRTHLNTDTFDPLKGFTSYTANKTNQGYDSNEKAYITKNIGGYGGATALGTLSYQIKDNEISIIVGAYNMEKFYNNPPMYELLETYEVTFIKGSTDIDLKVKKAAIAE